MFTDPKKIYKMLENVVEIKLFENSSSIYIEVVRGKRL